MGWNKGSLILGQIVELVLDEVGDPDKRYYMYEKMIDIFADYDCDTLDECLDIDPEYDRAYRNYYGEEAIEDDE